MRQQRLVYFLAHSILIIVGALLSVVASSLSIEWQKAASFAIGTSLIATGVCGMVVWVYLRANERGVEMLATIDKAGLKWIYPSRAAQIRTEYASRLTNASSQIDILGFGLSDFRRDYIDELEKLSARARVRILVLDPDSPYTGARDNEERQSAGIIAGEVREFIKSFKDRYPQPNNRLELRIYTSLPEVNIFRIDEDIFWGPYLMGRASGNTMTIRVRHGGFLFDSLAEHFERTWETYSRAV